MPQPGSPGAGPDPRSVDLVIENLGVTEPGPGHLGLLYEALLHPAARDAGSHYTPPDVAHRLVSAALVGRGTDDGRSSVTVWDPTCGGGAFLLAAADVLNELGHDPSAIVTEMLWGTDVDPGAAAVADASLRWWAESHGAHEAGPEAHLSVADVFLAGCPLPGGFHAVVGNPPFQGQMRGDTVRSVEQNRLLRERWGDVVGPYTDTAALALAVGASALRPSGRLAMVLPVSVLGARDARAARDAATARAALTGLWVAGEPVFSAEVDVCAVVLTAGASAPVRRWRSRGFDPLADSEAPRPGRSWAPLAAAALGVPEPVVSTKGTLADLAQVSAGFRDEYYGLIGHVREAPEDWERDLLPRARGGEHGDLGPLITSGLIEPGRVVWGERPVRFAKVDYRRPVVDLGSLRSAGGRAAARVSALAVPKLLVATQTKVGEAAVDEHGSWVASTPTITAVAPAEWLWRLAAVVCSPVGSALAATATAGAGRATGSIKHSVRSVRELALPVDHDAWIAGAEALRLGHRGEFVDAMAAAYRLTDDGEVRSWWMERAPWDR